MCFDAHKVCVFIFCLRVYTKRLASVLSDAFPVSQRKKNHESERKNRVETQTKRTARGDVSPINLARKKQIGVWV